MLFVYDDVVIVYSSEVCCERLRVRCAMRVACKVVWGAERAVCETGECECVHEFSHRLTSSPCLVRCLVVCLVYFPVVMPGRRASSSLRVSSFVASDLLLPPVVGRVMSPYR